MHTVIRQFQTADIAAIMDVWENANRLAHPFLAENFVDQVRSDIPNVYLPNADTWVAQTDGRVIGFIALIGNEIGAIFLQPAFHGMAIGKMLMDKARTLHGELELDVFKNNHIGRKFYTRYGFEEVAEQRHEATGLPLLRLKYTARKNLT